MEAATMDPARAAAETDGPEHPADADSNGYQPSEYAQISFDVGGTEPTTIALRLTGGKVDVSDELQKGQRIVLRVEAEVGEIAFVDKHDPKTGTVSGCERRQKARITGVRLLDS
jgi:hypothetical protein